MQSLIKLKLKLHIKFEFENQRTKSKKYIKQRSQIHQKRKKHTGLLMLRKSKSKSKCKPKHFYIPEYQQFIKIYTMNKIVEHLDAVNPDWNFAINHGLSTLPGWDTSDPNKRDKQCPCCQNIIQKEPIPLLQNTKQFGFLGFGVPLFYQFLKNCILMLGVYLGTYAAVSICWAYEHNKYFCQNIQQEKILNPQAFNEHQSALHLRHYAKVESQNVKEALQKIGEQAKPNFLQCQLVFIKLSRTQTFISDDQNVVRVISFIIQLALLLYGRQQIRFISEYYDEINTSMSDFSILFRCSYKVSQLQDKIKEYFKSSIFSLKNQIIVLVLPHIEKIQAKQEQERQLLKQYTLLKLEYQQNTYSQNRQEKLAMIEQKKKQYDQCKEQLEHLVHSYEQNGDNSMKKAQINKAIVIMQTEGKKKQILQIYKNINQEQAEKIFGKDNSVELEQAPQPRQINWQYIHSTKLSRIRSYAFGCCLSIIFVGIMATIFYFILGWKTNLVDQILQSQQQQGLPKNALWGPTILVIAAMLGVVLFNKFVMGTVLHKICHMQKHQTGTSREFAFALKYSLGMFFTTALMTLAVQAIRFNNFYQNYYGVIEEESIMFFMTTFFVPIIWLVNPFDLYRRIRRYFYMNSKKLTQRQANELMENFPYDIGKRYAEILKVVWFTYLYSSLIPIGVPMTVLGIFLYYWVDKFNLLRKSSINDQISGTLSPYALRLLDLSLLFIPAGQLFFDYFMRKTFSYWTIGCLVVAIIYMVLPWDKILEVLIAENFKLEQKTFSVAFNNKNEYKCFHPLYKHLNQHKHQYHENHQYSQKKARMNKAMKINPKNYAFN